MTFFQAILLGIVQGLTEFLPVSSSGHLVLSQEFMGLSHSGLLFEIVVHFSTLLAVLLFFWKDILALRMQQFKVLVIGTIPAVVIGLLFKDLFESLFATPLFVSVALLGTAGLNFWTDRLLGKQQSNGSEANNQASFPSIRNAVVIGFFQAFAIIPGISRSGSTIAGGMSQGLRKEQAFSFSFILSIPAILGATALQLLDVVEVGESIVIGPLLVGGFAAFISGYLSLKLLKKLVVRARFEIFAWYCVAVAVVSASVLLLGS